MEPMRGGKILIKIKHSALIKITTDTTVPNKGERYLSLLNIRIIEHITQLCIKPQYYLGTIYTPGINADCILDQPPRIIR